MLFGKRLTSKAFHGHGGKEKNYQKSISRPLEKEKHQTIFMPDSVSITHFYELHTQPTKGIPKDYTTWQRHQGSR
jgi:hypothetical protein